MNEVVFKVPSNPNVEMLLVSVTTEYHGDSGVNNMGVMEMGSHCSLPPVEMGPWDVSVLVRI